MNKAYATWPAMALGLAACISISDRGTAAETSGFGPAQIVASRAAAFDLSAAAFKGMKAAIDSGADVKTQAFAARGLERWARTLPSMFPQGTMEGTHARPEIWSNRADFEAKAAAYAAAAGKLAGLAEAGDAAGFAAQWPAVRASCAACHDLYRVEDKPAH